MLDVGLLGRAQPIVGREAAEVDSMLDPELLEILVCPETKEPVHVAEPALLERLNRAVSSGGVSNRGGELVAEPIEAGLVREDGRYLYPVKDDIPIMLIDEAIPLEDLP